MARRRRAVGRARVGDQTSMGMAFSAPGQDPRQWVSFATVDDDGTGKAAIEFDEDDGQPYVQVTLHPTEVPCRCRVGTSVAGNGEADWSPFVVGDEVVVVLPEGREDAGATIICRLNNALDKFPTDSVAGQDPTTNTFAFRRRRTPHVEEFSGPILWRNATSGAFINVADDGSITIKDGENAALQLSQDMIGFQGPSSETTPPKHLLQIDLVAGRFFLQVDDALLTLSSSSASPEVSMVSVPGSLTIGTAGNPPAEHAISTEATANAIAQIFLNLAAVLAPNGAPMSGTAIAAAITGWLASGYAAAWTTAATSPLNVPAVGLPAALAGAFAAATQKPPAAAVQLRPGIGAPGLLIG